MPKIAIAGFQHETNSHGIGQAGLAEFEMADSWPGLLSGEAVITGTQGMNLPIAGFVEAAKKENADLHPILWCAAEPSGPVTDDAFATIGDRILQGVSAGGIVDGIYLDLHGAMITQSHPDGEGALLERIRAHVGPTLPIAVSLDMHANVSARLVALSDVICIYRTYPHLDMAETGARAWRRLTAMLGQPKPAKALRRGSYLVPLHAQQTGAEPARSLYAELPDQATLHAELALGFTAGDTPDVGPSVVAYATTQQEADTIAENALLRLEAAKSGFDVALASPAQAVEKAVAVASDLPVIIADVQDNPGAGASSDTTGVLRALIRGHAPKTYLGLVHDPDLAAHAHHAGLDAVVEGTLGGRSGLAEDSPYEGRFRVISLSEGLVRYTGEMYGGGVATLGPACALRIEDTAADVTVVVCSIRNQCLDLAQFTHFGLQPEAAKIIVVKSTAHFRADFEPIAAEVICTAAPGLFPCEIDPLGRTRD